MPIADIGTAELAYERAGSGPPLLLIMGMSGTFLHWREAFLAELRRDFETVVYDHRGVGESTRLEGEVTIAELAQDAAGLLDTLGLSSAHVLGISMGGMIAQELTLTRPELIDTLTLGCTYCGGEGSTLMSPEVLQRIAAAVSSGDRALAVRTMWEVNVSAGFARDEDAFGEFAAIAARRAVATTVIMAQMRACAAHDTSARLHEVSAPTLVVHGTADEMIPVANAEPIHRRIPGSRLEILDGAGHLFFWEQPERAAELIRAHAAVRA